MDYENFDIGTVIWMVPFDGDFATLHLGQIAHYWYDFYGNIDKSIAMVYPYASNKENFKNWRNITQSVQVYKMETLE